LPQRAPVAQRVLVGWLVMELRQMFAAGLGGVAATIADVSSLVLMVETGTRVELAALIAAGVGAAIGFAFNKYLAFRDRSPLAICQLARFAVVAVATAVLIAIAMHVVAVRLGAPYVVAKLACSALVFLAWTYPAQRRLVFQPRPRLQPWMSLS
jgi:putative flippase GtrA